MARGKGKDYDANIEGWLTRFEKRFGVSQTRESLQKLSDARQLFYGELEYNITRLQFERLNEGLSERQQTEMLAGVRLVRYTYRSIKTHLFIKGVDKSNYDEKDLAVYPVYMNILTHKFAKKP